MLVHAQREAWITCERGFGRRSLSFALGFSTRLSNKRSCSIIMHSDFPPNDLLIPQTLFLIHAYVWLFAPGTSASQVPLD